MGIENLLKSIYFHLLNVNECSVQDWNFRQVTSPFTRLYLVTGGEGTVTYNYNRFELKPGRLYLIPSYSLCNYSSNTYLEHFYIHFIPQLKGGANLSKLFGFKYELEATAADFLLMKRILKINPGKELANSDPNKYAEKDLLPYSLSEGSAYQIAAKMETQGILLQLFSRFIEFKKETEPNTGLYPNSKISLAMDYIKLNLNKPIMLSELARICNLSNDYFSRLFLKTTGMRPIAYINRKRIENAQLQLVTSNDPIEKIALDAGIDNFSYFNRMFKKYSCFTPGEYRRLHRLV